MVQFSVFGADVGQGGNINTTSNGGSNGLGQATFSNASAIFDQDDVVVVQVQNPTSLNEIGNGSSVSDLTVFDSLADFQAYEAGGGTDASLIKFNYAPQNPGQTATVQSDVSGLGDGYVRFNANVLIPSDGGPTLNNTLTFAPGTGIGTGVSPIVLDHVADIDLDNDGSIDPGTVEEGNADFFLTDYTQICFCRDTHIETRDGPVAVQDLSVGMMVRTRDNGAQPIRWIGMSPARDRPVRIKAGAMGNARDLVVSPRHRMVLDGWKLELLFRYESALVTALELVNDANILRDPMSDVEYYHVMFDQHGIIFAEGAATESFHPDQPSLGGMDHSARTEIFDLFPDLERGLCRAEIAPNLPRLQASYVARNLGVFIT